MKIIEREIPKRGDYYRHFKGKVYVIIDGEAENCTNNADHSERFVIYRADENSSKIYIREQSEFLSPVDKEKYPDAKQHWRFEKDENNRRYLAL